MDNISILSILIVSIPESLAIFLISILLTGKANFNKKSDLFLKLSIASIIHCIIAFFSRRLSSSISENLLILLFFNILIYIVVFRFKLYESIACTLLGISSVVLFEVSTSEATLHLMKITIEEVYSSDSLRFLLSLPSRILQIILIFIIIKFKIKIFDFENTVSLKKEFNIQLVVYFLLIFIFILISVFLLTPIIFEDTSVINTSDIPIIRFNVYLSVFTIVILALVIRNFQDYYKRKSKLSSNEFKQNLDYLNDLLKEGNIEEAKETVKTLRDHLNKSLGND